MSIRDRINVVGKTDEASVNGYSPFQNNQRLVVVAVGHELFQDGRARNLAGVRNRISDVVLDAMNDTERPT